jgi:hypothetical protein
MNPNLLLWFRALGDAHRFNAGQIARVPVHWARASAIEFELANISYDRWNDRKDLQSGT